MRILLVEDDPVVALLAVATLQAEGHEVCGPAYNASEALCLAAAHPCDLALVDINLAGRDEGIALARRLRERDGVASLFLSGQTAVALANRDAALGLLRKPYAPQDLARSASIAQALLQGLPTTVPLPASLEQLQGYGWAEDVHPEDFERCVSMYESAFDARTTFTMPYRLRRADGEYRWFLDNGAPFYRNGTFAGYFGSCVDITEQRDIQEHQRVLLAELNHRVKNNLQLILSFLQLSKMRAQGDEAKTLMQAAITRICGVGTVQDELHKSTGGQVDLGDYLPNLARILLNAEGAGAATLEVHSQCVRMPFQLASNLGLIVNELVNNAFQHGRGASATVRLQVLQAEPGLPTITICDSGPGFSPALLAGETAPAAVRGLGLIDALARRCNARVERSNNPGARVSLNPAPRYGRSSPTGS